MDKKNQRILNHLTDAFFVVIPTAMTHENMDLNTSYELRKLYKSARKEAIKRVGVKNLPYGLQDYIQYLQLAYTAAQKESELYELMSKPSLTPENLKKIIEHQKTLKRIYTNLTGFIKAD